MNRPAAFGMLAAAAAFVTGCGGDPPPVRPTPAVLVVEDSGTERPMPLPEVHAAAEEGRAIEVVAIDRRTGRRTTVPPSLLEADPNRYIPVQVAGPPAASDSGR